LPPTQRDGLLQAVREATTDQFNRAAQVETDAIQELKTKGVTVEDCDRAAFRDRVSPMWDRFAQATPGAKPMLEAIKQTEKA
jgi:TRAP-type C4-dicarboxylate transport system substrate-binding protein